MLSLFGGVVLLPLLTIVFEQPHNAASAMALPFLSILLGKSKGIQLEVARGQSALDLAPDHCNINISLE